MITAHEPDAALAQGRCPPPRRRFLVVHNPQAGLGGARLIRGVGRALEARGATVTFVATPDGEAVAGVAALAEGADAVVAAGGDGTIRVLATALAGRAAPIGIIPCGTGNVMANEIGLPRGAAALAGVLIDGPVARIEGGLANGTPFFLMCGAGFDGDVVGRLRFELKAHLGKLMYVPSVLSALRTKQRIFEVELDGRRHEASWVVVAKARHYAGRFVIAPNAFMTSPGFSAVLFNAGTQVQRVKELLALAIGRVERASSVEIHPCRHVRILPPTSLPIQIDGDYLGTGGLEVASGGPVLNLIVPNALHRASIRPD